MNQTLQHGLKMKQAVDDWDRARLIAQAPDLLSECDRLAAVNAELVAALEEAVDLLNAVADSGGNVGDYGRDCFDAMEAARAALAKAK